MPTPKNSLTHRRCFPYASPPYKQFFVGYTHPSCDFPNTSRRFVLLGDECPCDIFERTGIYYRYFILCLQFSELSNEVELRRHELGLLADRLGQSSHSQLENKLAETLKGLEEEGEAVEAAKAAGAAAAAK